MMAALVVGVLEIVMNLRWWERKGQALMAVAVESAARELGRGRTLAQAYLLPQPLGAPGKLRSQF